jgi:hypothetical protein
MTGWSRRVGRASGPRELQQLRDAVQDIARQAGHAPGRARVVFQTVADCAIIGTAVISGVLASIHLWKALFPTKRVDRHDTSPARDDGREPPRRHRRLAEAVAGDGDERGRSREASR